MNHIQQCIESCHHFHAVNHPDVGFIACVAWETINLKPLLDGIYSEQKANAQLALEILLSSACITATGTSIGEAIVRLNDLIPHYKEVDALPDQQELLHVLMNYYKECCMADVFAPLPAHIRSRIEVLTAIITHEERHNE